MSSKSTPPDIHLAQRPEADALLGRSPLAALVGMLLDQQVPMEWAFSGPYTIASRLGADDLDAHEIAVRDPEEFAALLSEKPAVHRFPGSMAQRVQQLCQFLVEEYGGDAEAVWADAATGKERWTGAVRAPSDVVSTPEWLGVQGSFLFAEGWSGERGYLFGVDAAGRQKFGYAVTRPGADGGNAHSVQSVQSVAGSVAVLGTMGDDGYGVVAVDLASGRALWSRLIRSSDFQAHAAGGLCFLQDNGTLRGLDLRSGAERWNVPDVVTPGAYPRLASDGTTLLVVSVKVQAFRASDGAKLWTAVQETTTLSPATVHGERAYVFDGPGTLFALDLRTGKQVWHTASPLDLAGAGGAGGQGPTVSASAVAVATYALGDVPGFVVLRASDGKPLWAHRPSGSGAGGKSTWQLQTSGDTFFAASETTLYAFRSDTP